MKEVKIPAVGESITEATIANWIKKSGDYVKTGDVILEVETDKANVEVVAEANGVLNLKAKIGDIVKIGAVVAEIDTSKSMGNTTPASASTPTPKSTSAPQSISTPTPTPTPTSKFPSASAFATTSINTTAPITKSATSVSLSPAVRRMIGEKGLDPSAIEGTGKGGRLTKSDLMDAPVGGLEAARAVSVTTPSAPQSIIVPVRQRGEQIQERKKMSTIRKRIAERLVLAKQTAAILTTFNDVDMTAINQIREQYKDAFKEKYGINLGMMGFFVKAAVAALKKIPEVNAYIDKDELVYNHFINVAVAVGTPKGLIVPVIRDADFLTMPEIELTIRDFALRGREGKIKPDEMQGGTFTISNGGVYGSLMSTPILNHPQSGILGMHRIENRPVVIGTEIKIRPMMYLALSYDHRIIDGEQSVTFLKTIKQNIEDPNRLLIEI